MKRLCLFAVCVVLAVVFAASAPAADDAAKKQDRPNILWIVSEDNGPYLGCYGDKFAKTPSLDNLAADGILYKHAFANAPVCAPARSTIISGVYAPSMGTQHMRSRNRVPDNITLFPAYLRKAGYYCSNRSKTDYNRSNVPKEGWDQMGGGHYSKRKEGQPFFAIFNLGTSHESSLHRVPDVIPENLKPDFKLPPYHPDTPEIRSNWVEYYKIVTRMDAQVGQLLEELEKAGLAEDTIVFYYGDHGGILTRSKRFLFQTGVHVPMIVRFPKKYQYLAPGKPGSACERLVSFVDLAPTVLSLAGVDIPDYMEGHAFLGGQKTEPQKYVYLFRGRMDERYDMMRGVHDGRYKYIRNYMPHRIYGQHLDYLWRMAATRSWEKAYKEGKCNAAQRAFWETKPTEELYDNDTDWWEVDNLAGKPAYKETLERMRKANRDHLIAIRDSGFLPESEMIERAGNGTIYEMVRAPDKYPMQRIMAAAEVAGNRDPKNVPELVKLMKDKDAAIRFWAATGCVALGKKAAAAAPELEELLKDPTPSVRIAAAEALCVIGNPEKALPVLVAALDHQDNRVTLRAVNTLENIGEAARPAVDAIKEATKNGDGYVKRAATSAAQKLGEAVLEEEPKQRKKKRKRAK